MESETIKKIQNVLQKKMVKCKTESGDTLMCSINEAFSEFHENGHNCLGCNLQDHVSLIQSFLKTAKSYDSKEHFFSVYCILLYLLTERILEIMRIIGLPNGYKQSELKVFKEINIWSNFLKHPKAFILTHHPKYYFDNELFYRSKNKIIDFPFVERFYSGEDKNKYKDLVKQLRNNKNVIVVLPDPVRLTSDFCDACKVFIDIIKENKVYKEILNDLTTLTNFFEGDENV
jgi:hypothetical protein